MPAADMEDFSELCGVVVTYHPDARMIDNLPIIVAECGRVIVVDNGSLESERNRIAAVPGVELIALGQNLGIAAALNIGMRRAIIEGRRWIVTFDQDSTPRSGMIAALRVAARLHPQAAVIVPCILESERHGPYRWVRRHSRTRWLFERVSCEGTDLCGVTMAVSSGSMIETETWQRIGGFEDRLFIDYVDVDFCLNILRSGREIVVAAGARLDHRLGARQKGLFLGHEFWPTHHAAFRHYYIARNRVRIWRRHAAAVPHWAVFDMCFATYNAFRVVALEPEKLNKLKAMMLGTWDGFRGKSGPCPAQRWRAFQA